MTTVILAIVLFGVLVFIHELGHFTVAKLSDVYVERFALGFGPAIFKKKWGETEYAICLFPLGGYVKMRGEEMDDAKASDPRSFAAKSVWTRIAIVSMGPISNLILPVLLFSALFFVGVPFPIPQIGSVIPGYPAQKAGLKAGDKILKVQGKAVSTWNEMTQALNPRSGQVTEITYERENKIEALKLVPVSEMAPNVYGEKQMVGRIGVDLQPYRPVIGIFNSTADAAKTGLKTGDIIAAINGKKISYWWEFENAFSTSKTKKVQIERLLDNKTETLTFDLSSFPSLTKAGIERGELFIREIRPNSIAEEKGLKIGDKIVSLNGVNVDSWHAFRKQIQSNQGEEVVIGLLRNGSPTEIELIPKEITQKDELTQAKRKTRQLGVISCAIPSRPATQIERYLNPFKALKRGFQETYEISITTLVGLGRLVSGKLSLNALGGPISIFYLAGSSYRIGGWHSFLRMMAILSITLAILNFLPIPVLDGGHLFFFLIEAIKGSPVQTKVLQMAHQVGLMIVIGLMVLVFYVDINRFLVDWIRSLFS